MKKCILIIISYLLISVDSRAQTDSTFVRVGVMSGDIVEFAVDNLDNIYILNSRNQLRKYNMNGDSVAIYNDVKKFGQATLIDVSNPLKVLLYYKDFSTIVALDRFLNPVNTIDLRKHNIFQVKAIGQSYDNKVWVYDELENKLKKMDEDGTLLQETPDFRLLLGLAITPVKIYDENKYVYVYDPAYGVYVFDYYGALKNNIMILGWENFKVAGKFIFGSKNDTLFRYDIRTYLVDEWIMPKQILGSKAFNFSSSRLYALRKEEGTGNNSVLIYSIR